MHGSRPRLSRRNQDTRRALGVPAAAVTRGWPEADDLETEGEGQGCRQTSVKAAHRPLVKSDGSFRHTGSSAQMVGKSSLCLPRAVLTCVDEVLGRLSGCQCAHQPMRLWQRLHSGAGARPAAASLVRVLPGERLDPGSCLRLARLAPSRRRRPQHRRAASLPAWCALPGLIDSHYIACPRLPDTTSQSAPTTIPTHPRASTHPAR